MLAADALPLTEFVSAKGTGHDMPYGCIIQTANGAKGQVLRSRYLYWNPEGVALSDDPDVQTVCFVE